MNIPIYSSEEGYPSGSPSLRAIPGTTDNAVQGGHLAAFYKSCPKLQKAAQGTPERRFLVIPVLAIPTIYTCTS